MICILDKEVKSYRDVNFFVMDTDNLDYPTNLNEPIKKFISIAQRIGLLYPTIKIMNDKVSLKYDEENRFVIFTISNKKIEYAWGILGGTSKVGEIHDLIKQLSTFNSFVYNEH